MDINKLILASIRSADRTVQRQNPTTVFRHKPNVAPFKMDLSAKTFKDSDTFIKASKKDEEYARRVNYRYTINS